MTTPELIVRALRSTQSRSKRKLLDAAATTIESLTAQLEMARAERDAVTRRMIELEQAQGGHSPMRAIYKAPGEAPVIRDISDTRTSLKELLGGNIVTSHFSTDACIIMREGASKLPYNFNFCGYAVHGPALFVATSGRKFTDLSSTATDFLLGLLEPTEKEPCE